MKITIPKPCHENWENMILDESGRFCPICSKTVRDFTNVSDEEMINSLDPEKNLCGRFTDNQMGRNLKFPVLSKIALGLLAAGGGLVTVNGQELKNEEVKKVDFKKGIDGVEVINGTINRTYWLGMPSKKDIESTQPLIMLDGKKISEDRMKKIKADKVKSIKVFSGEGAEKLYGIAGKYGVIVIESKKKED
ncbi:hypothetical protein HNP38_001070 [Chryseobacterium defluvii]|uniref:TonB-dependent receptor-like protein n=1 Tax=Chryseobacterium defluvii TaxID=160396 RepID=A0A840KCQ9_9FLAO|nr:hypothetical protein [Chryseobacterium defluvii]MBB4805798.1 hypothetical protein [Chryseobacterium defluvii]